MKCSLLTLSCALDGELSKERQAELESHLVTCDRCRTGMRYLREETERISQLARVHIPPTTTTALLERARVVAPAAPGPTDSDRGRESAESGATILDLPETGGTALAGGLAAMPAVPDPTLWSSANPLPVPADREGPDGIPVSGSPAAESPEDVSAAPIAADDPGEEAASREGADAGGGGQLPGDLATESGNPPGPAPTGSPLEPPEAREPSPGEGPALLDSPGPEPAEDLDSPDLEPPEPKSPEVVDAVSHSELPQEAAIGGDAGADPEPDLAQDPAEAELTAPQFDDLWTDPPSEPDGERTGPAEVAPPGASAETAPEIGPAVTEPDPGGGEDHPDSSAPEHPGSGPWQRSWDPPARDLPVWTPASADEVWPEPDGEAPAEQPAGGDHDELMEVALEESANLRDQQTEEMLPGPAGPVWIPPPVGTAGGWQPKSDLLDFPAAPPALEPELDGPPPATPAPRTATPRRPAETVAPRTSERREGGQRIPPPHRPERAIPHLGRPVPGGRPWTRTATVAIAALAVFLIGWALTHQSAPKPAPSQTAQSSPTPTGTHSPATSPSPAPTLSLTGTSTFGGGGSGYQVQSARYGLHQNGTQLWVVFQLMRGTGAPKVTTGFDGPTTLYVEMSGVAAGAAVGQPPSGELVTSVQPGTVPGFTGAVYVIKLSRAAQVSGSLIPGSETGPAGERVLLELH